ncbi:MAG: tripartite tricarboxylate transporter substrate binding protein [Rhizobiales bacterium]|nr:tripartite tricarboxylate transporter substrate binding protein [Hyphomicrobiales bacterium]
MISNRNIRSVVAAAAVAVTTNGSAVAQNYPDKPIKIIIPSAAGGPTDVPARFAQQFLPPKFGQPVVIENRGGAAGAIGARAVASAPPDGYTLMIGNTSTLAVIPAVSASAGYNPVKDFTPIAKVTEGFQILVVHPDSPWKTVKELIDYAKANPGKLNYASTGPGGLPHLAAELFMLRSGTKMTNVSYRSGGESNTAVLTGAVDLTFENVAILGALVRDGKLRALGVQNKARTQVMPNVPTMAEAGVPDCEANTFFGLVAPAGTPAGIVARLNVAMNEGMQQPEVQKRINALGTTATAGTPADFAAYIALQHKKWVEVGKAAGVKIQ